MVLYKKVDPQEEMPPMKETIIFKPKNNILHTGTRNENNCIKSNQYNINPNYVYYPSQIEYWLKKL